MNYAGDDYVMGHLLRVARQTRKDTFKLNLVDGSATPLELLTPEIADVPQWYGKMFWRLIESHGSDRTFVVSAMLVVRFDLSKERPSTRYPELIHSPFDCDLRIVDARGKEHSAHFDGWWAPERQLYMNRYYQRTSVWMNLRTKVRRLFGGG